MIDICVLFFEADGPRVGLEEWLKDEKIASQKRATRNVLYPDVNGRWTILCTFVFESRRLQVHLAQRLFYERTSVVPRSNDAEDWLRPLRQVYSPLRRMSQHRRVT